MTPEYPKTLDPDKNIKIIDPLDKNLDTLKLSGYPIRPRFNCFYVKLLNV